MSALDFDVVNMQLGYPCYSEETHFRRLLLEVVISYESETYSFMKKKYENELISVYHLNWLFALTRQDPPF